jgi:cytochrome b561
MFHLTYYVTTCFWLRTQKSYLLLCIKTVCSKFGVLVPELSCKATRPNWHARWGLVVLDLRVARFFLTQYTQTVKKIPKYHNITKWTQSIPNGRKMLQMTIEFTNIFYSKTHQNLPKFGFWVLKTNQSGNPVRDWCFSDATIDRY